MEDRVSEMTKGYKDTQDSYRELLQLHTNAIAKIRSISSDIQSLERMTKEGTILCSKMGIVSGVVSVAGILAAPFTLGGSLGLTAVGTGIGIGSGAFDIIQTWANNCGIEAKCNEASTLLEVIQKRTEKFRGQIKNLYTSQRSVCISLKITHISLHAIGFACGKAVRDSISRNIPYIEQSSKALWLMYQSPETTICAAFNVTSTRTVVAPVVGKQAASGIAKKTSLRVIGTAAVCIAILVDVAKIANNRAALNQGKHSDLVTRLEDVANEMETEMKDEIKRYDKIVGG